MKTKMKEIEMIINNGDKAIELNTHSKLDIARIDVVNASGHIAMDDVVKTMGANLVQPLKTHRTKHHRTSLIQNAFRLYFKLDKELSKKDIKVIENELVVTLKSSYPDIDINNKGENDVKPTTDSNIEQLNKSIKTKLINERSLLRTNTYGELKGLEEQLKELQKETKVQFKQNPVSDKELIERAEYLSAREVFNTGSKTWKSLVIGVWNSQQKGQFDEETALNIIEALDTDNNTEEYYRSFKIDLTDSNKNISTIGSLIWHSDNEKFTRSYKDRYYTGDTGLKNGIIPKTTKYIDRYVSTEDMYELINSDNKNIIVDSPTGSGKTTATRRAVFKWLKEDNKNRYAFFALPTVALSDQETADGESGEPLKGRKIAKALREENFTELNVNFAFGTFDKTVRDVEDSIRHNSNAEILIVADEAHKEVLDYFFRKRAIKGLFDQRENYNVVKFLALSGTPQEINKEYYDEMVQFRIKDAKPIFNNFKVLTYSKGKEYMETTTSIIQKEIKEGRKVLQFINNKETIREIKKSLDKLDIKTVVIYSGIKDDEEKAAYEYLMDNKAFPAGYQVVLATSVIADGINILNENEDYSLIISPHRTQSPIFNTSMIKQMSNRFRNQYENIIIPLFVTEHATPKRLNHKKIYGLEERYNTLLEESNRLASFLKDKFKGRINRYHPGFYEIVSGLPYINSYHDSYGDEAKTLFKGDLTRYRHIQANKNMELEGRDASIIEQITHIEEHLFSPDKRTLRKTASRDAETYYAFFPFAFVNALEEILQIKSIEDTAVNYTEGIDEDIIKHFEKLRGMKIESNQQKRDIVEKVYTEDVANKVKELYLRHGRHLGDAEVHIQLKELMNNTDYKTMLLYTPYANHNEITKIIQSTPIGKGMNKLKDLFKSYQTLEAFNKSVSKTKTNLVYLVIKKELENLDNYDAEVKGQKYITNARIKEIIKSIADSYEGWKVSDIQAQFNEFFLYDSFRGSEGRGKGNFRRIDMASIGTEFDLSTDSIEKIYNNYKRHKLSPIVGN